jgi:hypothetical protein
MLQHRLFWRGLPILIVCLMGAFTSIATAGHTSGTSQLGGWTYIDRNNDGQLAFIDDPNPEFVIDNVQIRLFSKVGSVETLVASMFSDQFGRYFFDDLAPGTYVLRQTHPTQFVDGIDTLGQLIGLNGQPIPVGASAGTVSADAFLDITLTADLRGDFYNFGERGLTAASASKRFLFASAPELEFAVPEPAAAVLAVIAICGALSSRRSRRH